MYNSDSGKMDITIDLERSINERNMAEEELCDYVNNSHYAINTNDEDDKKRVLQDAQLALDNMKKHCENTSEIIHHSIGCIKSIASKMLELIATIEENTTNVKIGFSAEHLASYGEQLQKATANFNKIAENAVYVDATLAHAIHTVSDTINS